VQIFWRKREMVREEGFESPSIDFQSQWERMLSKRERRFR